MWHNAPWSLIAGFSALKGIAISVVTLIIGTGLGDSLLVATVSGGLGVIGMVLSAYISAEAARKNRDVLHDIKRRVGIDRREGDHAELERDQGDDDQGGEQ